MGLGNIVGWDDEGLDCDPVPSTDIDIDIGGGPSGRGGTVWLNKEDCGIIPELGAENDIGKIGGNSFDILEEWRVGPDSDRFRFLSLGSSG